MKKLLLILGLSYISASFNPLYQQALPVDQEAYEEDMTRWRNDRIRLLTAPEGWLSVIGLYWLKPGTNSLGAKEDMDIVLPKKFPPVLGQITIDDGKVLFESSAEAYVTQDGKRFTEGQMFTDQADQLTKLGFKTMIFYVIERGGRFALRIKNTLADKRFSLKEIASYPTDVNYRVYADVLDPGKKKNVKVEDVIGDVQSYEVMARLEFDINGKKQSLLAFDGGPDYYFLIFKDKTTGETTYGGGRYMYVPRKKEGEDRIVIDFNQAFNPPCVFTDYATCPIPPSENMLSVDVEAGEKYPIESSR